MNKRKRKKLQKSKDRKFDLLCAEVWKHDDERKKQAQEDCEGISRFWDMKVYITRPLEVIWFDI